MRLILKPVHIPLGFNLIELEALGDELLFEEAEPTYLDEPADINAPAVPGGFLQDTEKPVQDTSICAN